MLPLSSGLPTIGGTTTVGSTLTVSSGTWAGPTPSYAYQWDRCNSSGAACSVIPTATKQNYIPAATDVGSTLRVVVTATNKNGSAVATSPATATVTALSDPTTSTSTTTTASTTTTVSTPTTTTTSTSTTTTTPPPPTLGDSLASTLLPSTGTTFYVSTSGSDSNPGTLTAPWRTIQMALNVLQPGQQALVRGGTYTQDLMMSRAGTASAPITVAAYPGETVVLHAASTSGDTYPVQISGSYFRLHGFVIENGLGTSDANVYLWGGAHQIEVSGNEIRYGQDQGVFADNTTSYLQFLDNRVHDNGLNHVSGQHQSHGFYIEGSHDLFANNLIYNHPYGFGLQIYPANHDTVVVDNTIAASAHSSIVVGGSGGVYNITIRNNILYPSGGLHLPDRAGDDRPQRHLRLQGRTRRERLLQRRHERGQHPRRPPVCCFPEPRPAAAGRQSGRRPCDKSLVRDLRLRRVQPSAGPRAGHRRVRALETLV